MKITPASKDILTPMSISSEKAMSTQDISTILAEIQKMHDRLKRNLNEELETRLAAALRNSIGTLNNQLQITPTYQSPDYDNNLNDDIDFQFNKRISFVHMKQN